MMVLRMVRTSKLVVRRFQSVVFPVVSGDDVSLFPPPLVPTRVVEQQCLP